jgi:general secretion pathway protein D
MLAGCSSGRTAFDKAETLEREGRLDEALVKYAEATMVNPDIKEYRLRFLKISEESARIHIKAADSYLADKDYDNAIREYQTALALNPTMERAKQQTELAVKLRNSSLFYIEGVNFEKKHKMSDAFRSYKKAVELNPANKEAAESLKKLLKNTRTKLDGFELNLKSNKPITLKFKDTRIKDVFNILTRLSGINFVFDETLKDQNITIFLENATFNQALDIITSMNKLGRKVLNESTIIVYPKTPEKIKQYEELAVRTFFLNSLDAKKAINLLRTMLQIKKIYVNEELNAIVVRDVPETIDVAQKILEANDVPDAEVVLEVEVIELTKTNEETFGLLLSKYSVTAAATTPGGSTFLSDTFTPTTTTVVPTGSEVSTSSTTVNNLLNAFAWKGFQGYLTVPNATYNFGKTLSNAEVLANPKIRVKNREKAKFNVATREPITTISTTGTTGGFSTNVQYVDVGIKLNAEPTIQSNSEINLKLSLEVSSNLGSRTAADGTTLITIGTRNLESVLTLKDGETSIIGGLISANKSKRGNKIFILGDIPLIGPLLSNSTNRRDKTELILALTPRIVRLPAVPEPSLASFWSGREEDPSTSSPYASFAQEPEFIPEEPVTQQMPVGTVLPSEIVAPPAQLMPPAPPTPAVQPVTPVVPAPAMIQEQPQPPGAAPQMNGAGTLSLAAPAAVSVGEQFAIALNVAGIQNLHSAPFALTYDPELIDLTGVSEGSFLLKDGKQTVFKSSTTKEAGVIRVALQRVGNAGGANGSGTLASALFKAKKKGVAGFSLQDINFSSPGGSPVQVIPYNVAVEIR